VEADKTYTYRVSLTDDCNLTASKDVNVRVNSAPKAEIFSKDAICQNDSLVFYNVKHNNTMTKYTWKYDNRSSNTVGKTVATFTKSGVFLVSVEVTDSAGCSTTVIDTFEVIKNPITIITPSATEKSIFNPVIMFDGADSHDNIKTYAWNFAGLGTDTLDKTSFTFPDTGVYVVQLNVKNSNIIKGRTYYCYDSSEVSITIKDEVGLYIPNAFTPNNDGQNDMFSPKGFGFSKYEMRIFDRWGAEVFVSTDIEDTWNGGYNGGDNKAKEDVYVYLIKVEPNNKKEKERIFTGHVSLIR
jgi:gliding motility-associated-like protein